MIGRRAVSVRALPNPYSRCGVDQSNVVALELRVSGYDRETLDLGLSD
jgi:hypothetical protein